MPKSTLGRIAADKRERLLREAALLFAEGGFAKTDIAQIAARAGVAKGSIYNYFENKDDLYLHVCRDGLRRSREAVYGDLDPSSDLYDQVEHIFRAGIAFAREFPEYIVLYVNVSSPGMARFAQVLTREVESRTAKHLKVLIRRGIEQGTVSPSIDVNSAASLINTIYITVLSSMVSPHYRLRLLEYLELDEDCDEDTISVHLDRIVEMVHSLFRPTVGGEVTGATVMSKTTGGRIVAQMLQEEGVDTIFGIVDGTYLQFFASCVDLGMRMVTPRHESTAAHMAGAYSRLSGRIGVFMASNGPGVANVLPGVAVENGEGNRVLLITSCRRPQIAYPDRGGAYQAFDQSGVISAMSKWSETVKSMDRLPELVRAALRACYQGRPGVVHLDIPENIVNGKTDEIALPPPHQYRRVAPIEPPRSAVEEAARMLVDAKLPAIQAGSGVVHSRAFEELAELAELLHAPVLTSWAAQGALAETSPFSFPMIHVETVQEVRNAADLILGLGTDIGETDFWGKPPHWASTEDQALIQVDIDEQILGRNRPAALPVFGDAKVFLRELITLLRERKDDIDTAGRAERMAPLVASRDAHRAKLDEALADRSSPMLTAHVATVCRELYDDDAVVIFDGGNTAVWGNFYSQIRVPNTQIGTHHFGHLGAGLGQTLGAAVARPHSQVYCIIGDGAMGFHPQEIETAVRNELKVTFLVCCDRQWGMVKLTQSIGLDPFKTVARKVLGAEGEPMELPFKSGPLETAAQSLLGPLKDAATRAIGAAKTINADLGEIRFDDLARSMGAHGERVSSPDELKGAIERCQAETGPSVIHVDVDSAKHLWAPGLKHFKTMHQEPKGK